MAESINQSILNKARKDKFLLSLSIPAALKDFVTKTDRRTNEKSERTVIPDALQFSIFGAVVPGTSVPDTEIPYAGQTLRISTHARPAYDDVTVNFTIDNEFNNYWYIWRWLQVLNDPKLSTYDVNSDTPIGSRASLTSPNLLDDYQTTFTLFGLNEYNKQTIEFTYTKAFPISLGDITYSYRDPAEAECSFTFTFTQMLVKLL
jgi:hypothetical protein